MHQEASGRALIWTLDQTPEGDPSPEIRRAWDAFHEERLRKLVHCL